MKEQARCVGVEARLRPDHPLRAIRALADETLAAMERAFASLCSGMVASSIAPQILLRTMLLQAFYSTARSTGVQAAEMSAAPRLRFEMP